MKTSWIIYLLSILLFFFNEKKYDSLHISSGVLISPYHSGIFWDDTVCLLNQNETFYAKIWSDNKGTTIVKYYSDTINKNVIKQSLKKYYPARLKRYLNDGSLPKISIRSFDDGYDIPMLVFDAKKLDGKYQVFVNGKWKKIKYSQPLVYKKWEDFMLRVYIGDLKQDNPLKVAKSEKAEVIENYEKYYYEVVEIAGDWIKVKCWTDCEGCPSSGTIISGWIKWRTKNKLLVNLYFIC